MGKALVLAQQAAQQDEVPVGAIILLNQQVIAQDHNRTIQLNDATAHAEMLVLTAAMHQLGTRYLNECVIYVTLEPCPMCAFAMGLARVGRLVYGAGDPRMGFTRWKPSLLHPSTQVTGGILAEECGALLREFFARKRDKD